MDQSKPVTMQRVRDWAEQAIEGWFTGWSDLNEPDFQRYCFARDRDGSYWITERATGLVLGKVDIGVVVIGSWQRAASHG